MPIMRVRRSSDDDEQDFTAAERTDGTLADFCGAGDGFLRTWYDQSGNGRHAAQATAARQPQVVASGVVLDAPTFDGTENYLSVADPIIGAQWMSMCVFSMTDDERIGGLWESRQTGNIINRIVSYADTRTSPKRMGNYAPDGADRLFDLGSKLSPGTDYLETITADGSAVAGYINAAYQDDVAQAGALAMDTFHLGRQQIGAIHHKGSVRELVLYPAPNAARAAREANIAARHGITLAT